MIRTLALGGALSVVLAGSAMAQGPRQGMTMPPPDTTGPMAAPQFITAASQSDEFERQEGRLAETMAATPAVRHFGARMVSAHTKTTTDLHAAIRQAGMAVPPPPPLRPDQMQMISELRGMKGPQFDHAYIGQQIQAHQEALAVMTNYAESGDVPSLKAAARMTAPLVKEHLDMAKQLQGGMS